MVIIKRCDRCHSKDVIKKGKIPTVKKGHRQRWLCNKCGHTFY